MAEKCKMEVVGICGNVPQFMRMFSSICTGPQIHQFGNTK